MPGDSLATVLGSGGWDEEVQVEALTCMLDWGRGSARWIDGRVE